MPDIINRLDIVHEARFAKPAFELVRDFPQVLKGFYDALSSRHSLNSEHISVSSANVLSDLVIRIGMFNNVAAVELRADRMVVRLPTLNNVESVEIGKSVLTLSYEALEKTLPQITLRETSTIANIWLALEGGDQAAEQLLLRNAEPAAPPDPSKWGAEALRYTLRCLSRNETEGWTASIYAEPSLVQNAHLFLMIDFAFQRTGLRSISDQIAFIEIKLRAIARALGVSVPEEAIHA